MIDEFDRRLLKRLQIQGNATNADLAEASGMSVSQAGRRRVRLETEGTYNFGLVHPFIHPSVRLCETTV